MQQREARRADAGRWASASIDAVEGHDASRDGIGQLLDPQQLLALAGLARADQAELLDGQALELLELLADALRG